MRLESVNAEVEGGHGDGNGEMVITCYGIVGYITLATSKSESSLPPGSY